MPDETKKTRKKFCSKVYLDKEGQTSRHAHTDVTELQFQFTNDNTVSVKLTEIGKDCAKAAAWHGVAQKLGDAYNKAETPDEAQEAMEVMLERLMANEWVKPGEGAGPKTGVLVQAIINALIASGETMDEPRADAIRKKVSEKTGRDGAMANAGIQAEYKKLQAETAAEQAKKAAKAAKGTEDTLEGF